MTSWVATRQQRGPARVGDIVASIILMVGGIGVAVVGAFAAVFLVFATDSCGTGECDAGQFTTGWLIATFGPALAVLVSIAIGIVLMVKRRTSFWVPLVGIVLALAMWWLGAVISFGSVPGFTL